MRFRGSVIANSCASYRCRRDTCVDNTVTILRHNMAELEDADQAKKPTVGSKMYNFHLESDRVAFLNE